MLYWFYYQLNFVNFYPLWFFFQMIRQSVALLKCILNIIVLGVFVFLSLFVPPIKANIAEKFRKVHKGTYVKDEHCMSSIYTLAMFKQVWRAMYLNAFKTSRLHGNAPDVKVIRLSDLASAKLLDFQKSARPLVLNFGSCT